MGQEGTRREITNHNHWDNHTPGFAATLVRRASATGDEYVLAIRGTETEGDQLRIDLLGADVGEIGFIGMALSQTVLLVNYVFRLTSPAGLVAPQLALCTSSERARPEGKSAFGVAGDWYWIEAGPPAEGLRADRQLDSKKNEALHQQTQAVGCVSPVTVGGRGAGGGFYDAKLADDRKHFGHAGCPACVRGAYIEALPPLPIWSKARVQQLPTLGNRVEFRPLP